MNIDSIQPTTIRNTAIAAAIVLAPMVSYGAAYLLDLQKGSVSNAHAPAKLVKAPVAENEALPEELKQKISEAIALAESRS